MRTLLTGAAGFAGSHIAEELVANGHEVVALDSLTYAGRLDRLLDVRDKVKFVYHDFRTPLTASLLRQIGAVDHIIHNGADSHVLRSFEFPQLFADSNIIGTLNMLEAARHLKPAKFIYVSTDEVLGPGQEIPFKEDTVLRPTNPYAATKAGGEFLAYSYYRSFGLPVIITRTMNMFGERQHPEKFVPLTIKRLLEGKEAQIHGERRNGYWASGSRNWLHAREQAGALRFLLAHGKEGECYHVRGVERSNLDMLELICKYLNVRAAFEWNLPLGPVHDFNYALDDTKLRALGWCPRIPFEAALEKTVKWTAAHQEFLRS